MAIRNIPKLLLYVIIFLLMIFIIGMIKNCKFYDKKVNFKITYTNGTIDTLQLYTQSILDKECVYDYGDYPKICGVRTLEIIK